MRTKLTKKELSYYTYLYQDKMNYQEQDYDNSYLSVMFQSIIIKDKSLEEINFPFNLDVKKQFLTDSVLLFNRKNELFIGKIDKYFFGINEDGLIFFISKKIGNITNVLIDINLIIGSDNNMSFFNEDLKQFLDKYIDDTKKLGHKIDLLKDIHHYKNFNKDYASFISILNEYGIVE